MLFILAWLLWLYNNSNHGNANSNKQNNEEVKNNEKVITPSNNEDLEACFEDELEFKENVPLLSKEEKEDVKISLEQDEILEKTEKENEIYFKFPANSSVGSSFSSENSLIRNSYIDNKSAGSSTDDIIQEYLLASSQSAVSDISTECLFIGANHQHHGNESCQYEGDADNLVNLNKGSKTSIQGDVDFGATGEDQQEVPENLIEESSINLDHSQPEDSLNIPLVHEDSFYGLSPDDVKVQIQFPNLSFSARSDEVITPNEVIPQSSVESKQMDPKDLNGNKNQISRKELFTEEAIIQSEVSTDESAPSTDVLKEEEISPSKDHSREETLGEPSDFLTEDIISPSEVTSVESTPIEHTLRELDTSSSKEAYPTKCVPKDVVSSLENSSEEFKPTIDINMNVEKPILKDYMMEEQHSLKPLNEKVIFTPQVERDDTQATMDVSKTEEMSTIRDANLDEKVSLKSSIADEIISTGELTDVQPGGLEMNSLGNNQSNENATINTTEDLVFPVENENEEGTEKYEDIVNSSIELKKLADEINEVDKSVEENKTNPTLTSLEKSSISNTVEEVRQNQKSTLEIDLLDETYIQSSTYLHDIFINAHTPNKNSNTYTKNNYGKNEQGDSNLKIVSKVDINKHEHSKTNIVLSKSSASSPKHKVVLKMKSTQYKNQDIHDKDVSNSLDLKTETNSKKIIEKDNHMHVETTQPDTGNVTTINIIDKDSIMHVETIQSKIKASITDIEKDNLMHVTAIQPNIKTNIVDTERDSNMHVKTIHSTPSKKDHTDIHVKTSPLKLQETTGNIQVVVTDTETHSISSSDSSFFETNEISHSSEDLKRHSDIFPESQESDDSSRLSVEDLSQIKKRKKSPPRRIFNRMKKVFKPHHKQNKAKATSLPDLSNPLEESGKLKSSSTSGIDNFSFTDFVYIDEEDAYQRLEEPKSDELIPETREIVTESGNPELDEDMKYRTAHGTGVEITAEPIGRVHSIVVGQGQQPPKKTVNVAPQKTSFVLTTTNTNAESTDRKNQYENSIPITEDLVQEDIIEQNFGALDENEAYFYDLTSSSNKNEESDIKSEKNETNRLGLYEKLLNINKGSNEKLNNNDTDIRNEQTGVMSHQSTGMSQASMTSQPSMTSQTSMTSQQPEPISPKKVPPTVARKPTKSESDDKETSPGRLKQQTSTRRPIKQLEQPEAEMTDFMKIMKKRKTHVDTMDNAGRLLGQIANRDEKIYGGKRTLSKNWRIVKQAVRKKEYLRFKDKPMPKLGQ